jgi:hypothetical protein
MVPTRARVSSLLEWVAAVACIIGLAAVGSVIVRDLRTVSAVAPVIANEEAAADPPASIPARSVSVPVLLLANGAELRVGDTAAEISKKLAGQSEVAPAAIDRTASGERVTRFYAVNGQRFAVVLEPLAGDGQVRVGAIYLPSSR